MCRGKEVQKKKKFKMSRFGIWYFHWIASTRTSRGERTRGPKQNNLFPRPTLFFRRVRLLERCEGLTRAGSHVRQAIWAIAEWDGCSSYASGFTADH